MVIIKTIDAKVLSRMFLAGAKNLEAKKEWINELNVFPVPDGDTGTNMTLTIMSAAAAGNCSGRPGYGNTGKSNFFRFSYVEQEETPVLSFPSFSGASPRASRKSRRTGCNRNRRCNGACSGNSIQSCYETKRRNHPYRSKRSGSSRQQRLLRKQKIWSHFLKRSLHMQKHTLAKTPEMLPVLKEAGVVDSGGQGLLEVLRGAIDGFLGKEVDYTDFAEICRTCCYKDLPSGRSRYQVRLLYRIYHSSGQANASGRRAFISKNFLTSIGDSIVLVADDEIVKVHVHTNHPGQAIETGTYLWCTFPYED